MAGPDGLEAGAIRRGPRIRILIAEDHRVVREGTRRLLEEQRDLEVVAEASDGEEAVIQAVKTCPDVVLLDIRLPRLNGVEATERLRALCPETRVLVLSAYDDDDYVFAMMEAGAAGYLLKTASAGEVAEAVRAVARGEVVLHPAVAQKLARLWARGRADPSSPAGRSENPLSAREMEVLRLVARGMRNKEIAESLKVSVRTVEGHLNSIFTKLGVSSRTEAVIYAATQQWLTLAGGADGP